MMTVASGCNCSALAVHMEVTGPSTASAIAWALALPLAAAVHKDRA